MAQITTRNKAKSHNQHYALGGKMSLAQDTVNGLSCSWCGVYFEAEHGFPVLCISCWEDAIDKHKSNKVILHNFGLQKAIHGEL